MNNKAVIELIITVVEGLIEEIEGQGETMITTNNLRKFIHNMENNINVKGKKRGGKIDK